MKVQSTRNQKLLKLHMWVRPLLSILYFSHLQLSLIFSHYNIATMKVLAFPLTTNKYVLPVQNIKSKTEITSARPAW